MSDFNVDYFYNIVKYDHMQMNPLIRKPPFAVLPASAKKPDYTLLDILYRSAMLYLGLPLFCYSKDEGERRVTESCKIFLYILY